MAWPIFQGGKRKYDIAASKWQLRYTDYAIELFNHAYSYETKPADYTDRQANAEKALLNALAIQSTSTANFVMSQHVYNVIYDLEESLRLIRGTTAADVAKKKALNDQINKKYEDLHNYSLKAYELFGANERRNQPV